MKIVVEIVLLALLALGTYLGYRKGLLKSLVGFVGLVTIVIISYALKTPLAEFLIDLMPFFDFGGDLAELSALNILMYNIVAFIIIFVLLYCILNIILSLTGFIDTLLKYTVIWVIPSKIGGAVVGFLETWVFIFLAVFVMSQFSVTHNFVHDSFVGSLILDNTPVVGKVVRGYTQDVIKLDENGKEMVNKQGEKITEVYSTAEFIYHAIDNFPSEQHQTKEELNLYILQLLVNNNFVTAEKSQELMDIGKIELKDVMIVRPS